MDECIGVLLFDVVQETVRCCLVGFPCLFLSRSHSSDREQKKKMAVVVVQHRRPPSDGDDDDVCVCVCMCLAAEQMPFNCPLGPSQSTHSGFPEEVRHLDAPISLSLHPCLSCVCPLNQI